MRIAFVVLLALHGFAHQAGFLAAWQLREFRHTSLETTLLSGRIDVGVAGIRTMGILWLVTGLTFMIAAGVGVWRRPDWWLALTAGVAGLSLALSVLGWPAARIGVVVNLAVLIVVGLAAAGLVRLA